MQIKEIADEELMSLYQNGSETAFQSLYERHSGKVYGFLKKRILSDEKVNDIFQEVFLKIHRSKHLYKKSFPVLPWFFTITKTVMIDELRKDKRKVSISDLVSEQDIQAIPAQSSKSLTDSQEHIIQFIETLPESQKVAMRLRYTEEKTFAEIAVVLSTTDTNARKLVSRGLQRIKELIQSDGEKL